jgi:hypothetical protein
MVKKYAVSDCYVKRTTRRVAIRTLKSGEFGAWDKLALSLRFGLSLCTELVGKEISIDENQSRHLRSVLRRE